MRTETISLLASSVRLPWVTDRKAPSEHNLTDVPWNLPVPVSRAVRSGVVMSGVLVKGQRVGRRVCFNDLAESVARTWLLSALRSWPLRRTAAIA
jgi:hypothetical protein